jgi:hypothetical protein
MTLLHQLTASPEEERAFRQGFERGFRQGFDRGAVRDAPVKEPVADVARRRRAEYWFWRSGVALAAGDEERAARLERWAVAELEEVGS